MARKNPGNFFNENEQVAYCPALIVSGTVSCDIQHIRLVLLLGSLAALSYLLLHWLWPDSCMPQAALQALQTWACISRTHCKDCSCSVLS